MKELLNVRKKHCNVIKELHEVIKERGDVLKELVIGLKKRHDVLKNKSFVCIIDVQLLNGANATEA